MNCTYYAVIKLGSVTKISAPFWELNNLVDWCRETATEHEVVSYYCDRHDGYAYRVRPDSGNPYGVQIGNVVPRHKESVNA